MNDKRKELSERKELDTEATVEEIKKIAQIGMFGTDIMFLLAIGIGMLIDYSLDFLSIYIVAIIVMSAVALLIWRHLLVSKLIDRRFDGVEIKIYKYVDQP